MSRSSKNGKLSPMNESISLSEDNLRFLEKISADEELSCSEFINLLLEKMQEQPQPVGGWLAEQS